MTTRHVSVTLPVTLLGGWAPPTTRRVSMTQPGPGLHDYTARLRDSANDPARGLGTIYDPASLCDSARASGPGYWNYSKSLSDLTHGFRVGVTESGSIVMATSRWLKADTLRGSVR